MQAQRYIQSINYEVADFWKESNNLWIALNNNQVTYILKDNDIKAFYKVICGDVESADATKITELLNA